MIYLVANIIIWKIVLNWPQVNESGHSLAMSITTGSSSRCAYFITFSCIFTFWDSRKKDNKCHRAFLIVAFNAAFRSRIPFAHKRMYVTFCVLFMQQASNHVYIVIVLFSFFAYSLGVYYFVWQHHCFWKLSTLITYFSRVYVPCVQKKSSPVQCLF